MQCLSSSSSVVLGEVLPLASSGIQYSKRTATAPSLPVAINATFKVESLCSLVSLRINLHISSKPSSECVNVKPLTHAGRAFFPSTLTSLPDTCCMLVMLCIGTAVSSMEMTQNQTQTTFTYTCNANPKQWRRPQTQEQHNFPINCGMMNNVAEWLFQG